MTDLIQLSFDSPLEIRSDSGGSDAGRLVSGIIVPWESPTLVDYGQAIEVFKRGSLTQTLKSASATFPLYVRHDRDQPIGRMVAWRDDALGQWAEFRLARTPRAEEALELIREEIWSGFSIGFRAIDARTDTKRDQDTGLPIYVRREVKLDHVGLLASHMAAYPDAKVLALREQDNDEHAAAIARAEARKRMRSRQAS